ncbi:MAG: ribose-phosphate diphosphokinase [Infirmifilum sp.]
MRDLTVVSGSGCSGLALAVSRLLNVVFQPVIVREFPDGELYVRVPTDVNGRKVVLVECAGRRPNSAFMETIFTVKTLIKKGAREVILALPYFPYARQDAEFNPGESESLRIIADLLSDLGVSSVVTVDMHLHRFKSMNEIFRIKTVNVTAMRDLARYVSRNYPGVSLVIGPDEEAEQWARLFAEELGSPYAVLEKERRGDEEVTVSGGVEARGQVVIVDDIISTGATIATTASSLKSKGVTDIIVACTHGLLVGGAESKIFTSGVKDIITSDTITNPFAKVSVAPSLADGIARVVLDG